MKTSDIVIPQYSFVSEELTTAYNVLEKHYEANKKSSLQIWSNPNIPLFEDVYHTSIYNMLKCLGKKMMPENELLHYYFRAFRVNTIRMYGYSYNRLQDDIDIDGMLLPIHIEDNIVNHLDGWGMIDLAKKQFGDVKSNALLDNLNGIPYQAIQTKHNVSYYELQKMKDFLQNYYKRDRRLHMSF